MERKKFLKAFALAAVTGPMIVESCKKDAADKSGTTTTTGTTTSTTTSTNSDCIVTATETEGPYPYPGGELTNPLKRTDITEGTQTGIPLALTIIIANADSSCAVVENARVDIWHCNKDGYYSGYGSQQGVLGGKSYVGSTFLRGYQLTDANGQVKFTTIFPGWYGGRTTHIHLEVYINNVMKKTTQIAFPQTIVDAVDVSTLYASLGVNPIRNTTDSIMGNSATDLANETVSLTGSIAAGYSGTYTIGLAL
ncbi:MAG TPA: intradiol ring-cleavage dioxygenase [Mucilaginibacter sp.]|jgi:protocatechuate 3,4-dioxygenase beta subunit